MDVKLFQYCLQGRESLKNRIKLCVVLAEISSRFEARVLFQHDNHRSNPRLVQSTSDIVEHLIREAREVAWS